MPSRPSLLLGAMLPLSVYLNVRGDNTKAYMFDEPSLDTMQGTLDKSVEDEYIPPNVGDMRIIDDPAPDLMEVAAEHVYKRSGCYELGYDRRHVDVLSTKMNPNNRTLFMTMVMCLHMPSRAYGRVIHVQVFCEMQQDAIAEFHIVQCSLIGVVPQDRIEFQGI